MDRRILTDAQIESIIASERVLEAKHRLPMSNSVSFTMELPTEVKTVLQDSLGLDLPEQVPLRWIKGDTPSHADVGQSSFERTHLVYLTDSIGEFHLGEETFPICKGESFVFPHGTLHGTSHTGTTPRLMLGPMSEHAEPVGGPPQPWNWYDATASPSLAGVPVARVVGDSSGQYILITSFDNGVYYSQDYGATFTQSSLNANSSLIAVSRDASIMYAIAIPVSTPVLYYSTNQGTTWTACTHQPSITNPNFSAICCEEDGTNVVLSTQFVNNGGSFTTSEVYYTPNPNTTAWATSNITTSSNVFISSVACDAAGTYYVATAASVNGWTGGIWTSTNKGQTWTLNTSTGITNVDTNIWLSVVCSQNGTFVACSNGQWIGGGGNPQTYGGPVIRCTDPTGAWSVVSSFGNYTIAGWVVACNSDATNIFVTALTATQSGLSYGGLFYSIGGGASAYDPYIDSQGFEVSSVFVDSSGLPLLVTVSGINPANGLITTNGGAICFLEGTMILTDVGYKAIETLKIGDKIKTLKHGFKPITLMGTGKIFNSGNSSRTREKLYEYRDGPILTGGHSVLLDDVSGDQLERIKESFGNLFFTEGKIRLMAKDDETAVPYPIKGHFSIYNFVLEAPNDRTNYGVFANGKLVESSFPYWVKKMNRLE